MSLSSTENSVQNTNEIGAQSARILLGWLSHEEALLWLNGRVQSNTPTPEHVLKANSTKQAVANRATIGIGQTIIEDLPASLSDYLNKLNQIPAAQEMYKQGFTLALCNLNEVRVAQPQVMIEQAHKRVELANENDLESIAQISLPINAPEHFKLNYDQVKNAFIFSSTNPNLRVMGNFSAPLQVGLNGYGFAVGISPSFIQVGKFEDKYFLRDGYHRSVALVNRGITRVPVMFKEFKTFEEIGFPPGMLPFNQYLGSKPPFLKDYLNDEVSVETKIKAVTKIVIIQATEVAAL